MAVAAVLASGHVGGGSGKWWEPVWLERAALFEKKYELGKKKKRKTRLLGRRRRRRQWGRRHTAPTVVVVVVRHSRFFECWNG